MKKIKVALIAALMCCVSGVSLADSIPAGRLPDPKLTPGAWRTHDKTDIYICGKTPGDRHSTRAIRKLLKQGLIEQVYRDYGHKTHKDGVCAGVKQFCQADHLGSLELGGIPDVKENLWIQPYEGEWNAHDKDKLENELHKRVCAGTMDLVDVQNRVTTNWIQLYKEVFKTQVPLPIGKHQAVSE